MRNVIDDLCAGAIGIRHIGAVIFKPAWMGGNKRLGIEPNLGRSVDKIAIGQDLVRRAPQRQVIDRDFHWHAGRHGRGASRDEGVSRQDLFDGGVKAVSQANQRIAGLGCVIDQFARLVARPLRKWTGGRRDRRLTRCVCQVFGRWKGAYLYAFGVYAAGIWQSNWSAGPQSQADDQGAG